jgi:chorismate--pyruvate lyase
MILDLSQTSWFSQVEQLNPAPSDNMSEWLTKPYVLGKALEQAHGKIEVQVLSESFDQHPFNHELALLPNINQAAPFFVRETYLKSSEKILTYGRVVIPDITFEHNKSKFLELKNKSIATILYSHPNYTRGPFEYTVTEQGGGPLWGRRSVFWLADDPLIVTEIHMTDLGPYPEPKPRSVFSNL